MTSTENPSKRTEHSDQHRRSRVSFATGTKGPNYAHGGRIVRPSRPKGDIPPSDHGPSASSPVADKSDDDLLWTAKGFIDELYQQHIVLDTKHRCLEYCREQVIFYLGNEQKRLDSTTKKGKKRNTSIDGLQQAHRELVKQKERGFGASRNSSDKPSADVEAFSGNILKVQVSMGRIGERIEVLSYLNKAVELLRELCNTYNRAEILELRGEYEELDSKRLERRQQSASQQASTATTKSTADLHHSSVVKLYQRAKSMRHQEANSQLRDSLTAKLDRQMKKTEDLRRKLEKPYLGN
ncbi:hypothetical protein ACEPAG_8838 [Sanghuangporus baumii]